MLAGSVPVAARRGIAVLCDGGGHATLVVAVLGVAGVEPAVLAPDTQDRLCRLLGPPAAVRWSAGARLQ